MVEKFADFIFKLNNLGVSDLKRELICFAKSLFEFKSAFEMMNQNEFTDWVWKLYNSMV